MFSLIGECRFWTTSPDIKIKATDFGSFRYHDKKEQPPAAVESSSSDDTLSLSANKLYADAKREYSELRGHKVQVDNKRPQKLKDSLRKLEEMVRDHPIVHSQWRDNAVLRLMLSNGLLVHICLNVLTGSLLRIAYDKYFVGKIVSDAITDVLITKQHIVIAYNQNQITFVYLQKPTLRRNAPEKISRMEPKIFHIIIGGPSSTQGRRLSRRIACNASFDLIAIWTKSSQNEVYPWRPTVRDQDRANIHVYKLSRGKLEPVCFHWTENDPIYLDFVLAQQNQLKIVVQRVTRKGEVFIEDQLYEIVSKGRGLQRIGITSIPLQSQVCCQSYSPDQEKLMLGCIDGNVCLFDAQRAVTHMVRAGFIPTLLSWHCDSAVVLVANERGQMQFFDVSLGCVKSQLASEDMVPGNLLDLSPYFNHQPTMRMAMFNRKPELQLNTERYAQTDSFLFVAFEGGPVGSLRLFGGCGLKGDIHTSGFTVDVLVHNYLTANLVERAINLLLCLNWDVYGAMCLISLHKICNFIFRNPLTAEREAQLQKALGSFHAPVKPLQEDTEVEFGEQVNDIMRKFFQYLLRFRAYEKAFALGIDINDEDLFVDLYNAAKLEKNEELANDALRKAQEILRHADENQSACSHSSCSYCGSVESVSGSEEEDGVAVTEQQSNSDESPSKRPDILECSSEGKIIPQLPKTTYREPCYIPPLPLPSISSSSITSTVAATTARTPFQGSSHQRMFIPKPQLTVSHRSSTGAAAAMRHRNEEKKLLVAQQKQLAPPLLKNNVNYDQSLNEIDVDDFVYDYVPKTASKRVLGNHLQQQSQQQQDDEVGEYQQQIANGMRREYVQGVNQMMMMRNGGGEHMVIDIFPKPATVVAGDIDQTLGIPVPGPYDVPGVLKTNLPRQPMHLNPLLMASGQQIHANVMQQQQQHKTERPLQVVHQYPLISGQIPPANGVGGESQLNKFNMMLRPFNDGPPVVQPSAMGGSSNSGGGGGAGSGSGAGTSSNSSKSSGEKNKVKFSETIQVAVLPEIPRKEKPMERMMMKGQRGSSGSGHPSGGMLASGGGSGTGGGATRRMIYHTDPRRELADSLPLCHPNEDYLKDFQPAALVTSSEDPAQPPHQPAGEEEGEQERRRGPGTIKVIHFGVV